MNTRPPSQHETLNDEERELARVVRALPGGEPPPALDALILKAATDAVASSASPKKSPWTKSLLGTSVLWMGTAAASILTVGVGWQVFQSMRAPIYELPADENVSSAQETDNIHKNESLIVEVVPARQPMPTTPPPPDAFSGAGQTDNAADSAVAVEKPKAVAPDKPKKEMLARREIADAMTEKADKDETSRRRDEAATSAGLLGETAVAPAAPPPPPAAMAAAPRVSSDDDLAKEIDEVNVTGSKIRRVVEAEGKQSSKPLSRSAYAQQIRTSVEEDAKLAPAEWLDAIKVRVERNDIEGARASLKRYRETHPTLRVPDELKFLLK